MNNNYFKSCSSGRGGVIYIRQENMYLKINDNIFDSCTADYDGGGRY